MILTCIARTGADLPERNVDERAGYGRREMFPLGVGQNYVPFAMTLRAGDVWYYVLDDTGRPYPVWYPAALFRVLDGRLSRHWVYSYLSAGEYAAPIWAFPEWSADPDDFYDRLSDRDPKAVDIFSRYCESMLLEFRDSSVAATAKDLGDGWVICPRCTESWNASLVPEEMTRCPDCGLLMNLAG